MDTTPVRTIYSPNPGVQQNHLDEWVCDSGIDLELTLLNLRSLSGEQAKEALLYSPEVRHLDGSIDIFWQSHYSHLENGGWFCGSTPETLWGCVKPATPRFDENRGRLIKYEHPVKVATELFRLGVPKQIWQKIADRYGLPIPEASIDFWGWVKAHPQIPIVLTEGAKKAGALLTAGFIAISASGCWNFRRKLESSRLHPQLLPFVHPTRQFVFAFDQDPKQRSQRDVNQAITATAKLIAHNLKLQGCEKPFEQIKIASWSPNYKGVDDLLVGLGQIGVEEAINQAKLYSNWQQTLLKQLTYPISYRFNSPKFHDIVFPSDARIVGLIGAKGSGKTWCLEQRSKQWLAEDKGIVLPVHRRNLARHLGQRLGLTYVEDLETQAEVRPKSLTLCMDSLHELSKAKFKPYDWQGCILIIDEVEQVLWHLLEADTEVKKHRVKVLNNLQAVAQLASQIVLSDADLSDLAIDFFKGLLGVDWEPYIIKNDAPPKPWKIYNYGGKNPKHLAKTAEEYLKQGKKILVHTASQKAKSIYSTINLEKRWKAEFPNLRILRVDAESLADPTHPAFGCMSNLDLRFEFYDVVLASPVISTGVSIDLEGHFQAVFCIDQGVQDCNSVRQTISRCREPVERHIWIPKVGLSFIGIRSTNWQEIKHNESVKTKTVLAALRRHDTTISEEAIDTDFQPCATETWAKKAALNNAGMWHYRETIIADLEAEGHEIIPVDEDATSDQIHHEINLQRIETYQQYCTAVANALDVDEEEYKRLKDATAITEPERLAKNKYFLKDRYQIPVYPELVGLDDAGIYSKWLLHFYSTVATGFLGERDHQLASREIESGEGQIWKRDFTKHKLSPKVSLLKRLGLLDVLEKSEIRGDDPEIQAIGKKLGESAYEFGLTFNKKLRDLDKPVSLIKQGLETLGLKTAYIRRAGGKGQQVRIYAQPAPDFERDESGKLIKDEQGQPIPLSDNRETVFEAWLNQAQERHTKAEVEKLIKALEACEDIETYNKLRENPLMEVAWNDSRVSTDAKAKIFTLCANPTQAKPAIPPYQILNPNDSDTYQLALERILKARELSLDIETFGQGKYGGLHPWKAQIRLIQMCCDGEITFIADMGERMSNREQIATAHQPLLKLLEQKLKDETLIIGHNIHFDLRMLATQYGLRFATNIWDTLLGFRTFFGDYGKQNVLKSFGLGHLVKQFLNLDIDKSEQTSDWGAVLTQEQIQYAATDPGVTWLLLRKLLNLYEQPENYGFETLAQPGLLEAWEDENNAIPAAVEIELAGMPIDREMAQDLLKQVEQLKADLIAQWQEFSPDITYSQVGKLKQFLNDNHGLNLTKLDKGSLALHKDNPLVGLRLRIQALDTQANQLKALLRSSQRDNRIHTVYRTLTGFGRFSSGESRKFDDLPNLQSISAKASPILKEYGLPKLRSVVRPATGRVMAVIDLAGAHGRIAADQAQDETAIAGNNDPTIDNHSKVAAYIAKAQGLDWDWEYIAKAKSEASHPDNAQATLFRDTAKNTYYGWLNGAGAERIQEQITANTGKKPTLDACKAAIKGCEQLYPKVVQFRRDLMQSLKASAIKIGDKYFVVNQMSVGSRILHPMVERFNGLEAPYTQSLAAIWTRIEATAVKRSLPKLLNLIQANPEWNLKLINYVHDEIDIEVDEAFAEEAVIAVNNIIGDEFQKTMTNVKDGRVTNWKKLVVKSWADK